MWIEALRQVRNPSLERFEIRSASGEVLLVLPFSEIIESGRGAKRRSVPDFAALRKMMERAEAARGQLMSEIDLARQQLREARTTLARLDALSRE
jgi:hypothetical protein